MREYCLPVLDIPCLSEKTCQEIIEYSNLHQNRFRGYDNIDGKTVELNVPNHYMGFSYLNLNLDPKDFSFGVYVCESNNIRIDYNDPIIFMIQRSKWRVPPHTDPQRRASLLYHIQGTATTNFYTMENHVPNIDYSSVELTKVQSITMDMNTWYLFDNRTIHEVELISTGIRLSFVINLFDRFRDFEDARQNYRKIFL